MAEALTDPSNQPAITAIKTGIAWGKPPGFMLGGPGGWTARDRVVALGYQLYLETLCPECGHPVDVCRTADGWFEVKTATCHAKAAVESHTSEPGYKPMPGQILYPALEKNTGGATSYGAPPEGWEF